MLETYASHGEDIEEVIYKMPYTDIITTYLVENIDDSFIHTEKEPGKRYYGTMDIDGPKCYMVSEICQDYKVAVTYPISTANQNVGMVTIILAVALLCAFVIINLVVSKSFIVLEKSLE